VRRVTYRLWVATVAYDFDIGSGFAGEVRPLDVYGQLPMYSSQKYVVLKRGRLRANELYNAE
jgi:hypothetical protein